MKGKSTFILLLFSLFFSASVWAQEIEVSGKVISKSAIAEHLSGDLADMLDNHDFIYAHIKNLKKKLTDAGLGNYLKTLYGNGYKWEV